MWTSVVYVGKGTVIRTTAGGYPARQTVDQDS